jgi:alpha-beta hydrolase superfamily lysophospholipase
MTSTTLNRPVRPLAWVRRARALPREVLLFLGALAVLALHLLDDNFLQPPPGTTPGDHLVSGLVPLAGLALAGWAYPRLRGGRRAALALGLGVLGIAAGIEGFYYAREVGPSGDDFSGLLCLPAGVLLLVVGAVTLWRTRRVEGSLWWRYPRRALIAAGAALTLPLVVIAGYGYVTTHVGRAVVPADRLGVPHEDVAFTTGDGLELEGWYIPSRNGAAVIAFPGRSGSQEQARMLARHGYGVLLFDRRGEGASEGEPNSWGWGGHRDVEAAIAYLQHRPDVDPDRIGGIGLSVGGEMMIETAARTDELAAVVSEGAGARSFAEDRDLPARGPVDRMLGTLMSATKTAVVAISSNQSPPANLEDLAAEVTQPLLLIAAPNSRHGEELNRGYAHAAGENATLWEIPESDHVGGLEARPAEYERRVIGFLDDALAP